MKKYERNDAAPLSYEDAKYHLRVLANDLGMDDFQYLTFLHNKYNIPMDKTPEEQVIMGVKNHYLEMHNHAITKGSDDRYWTRIDTPDADKPYKQVVRKTKKDLENYIVNYYRERDTIHSIKDVFEEVSIDRKSVVTNATITCDSGTYKRFFEGTDLEKMQISAITRDDLQAFNINAIIKHHINKKAFSKLKTLENQIWDFAVEKGYASVNVPKNLKNITKVFFHDDNSLDAVAVANKYPELVKKYWGSIDTFTSLSEYDLPQVYSGLEQKKLIETCYKQYKELKNPAYLGIILNFCLGLRIGELVALKPTDFDLEKRVVKIDRREVTDFDKETNKRFYRITRRLKSKASRRAIPLTKTCIDVFKLILEYNENKGLTSEYLFNSKTTGERMHSNSFDKALDYANEAAGIPQRSNHDIRRTVLSKLEMSHAFTITQMRELAGHSPASYVLYTNYLHTIEGLDRIEECRTYEDVIEFGMPDIFSNSDTCQNGTNTISCTYKTIPFRKVKYSMNAAKSNTK